MRVTDADRSITFYTAVGHEIVGRVAGTPIGDLTMLKLPGDEFVTVELVHGGGHTVRAGGALDHLVIAVESMAETVARLTARGIAVDPPTSPEGSEDLLTTMIADPDGNPIELVQWALGHPESSAPIPPAGYK